MNIIDRKVLSLNGLWQAIGVKTVKDAFVAMNGGDTNNPPAKALDISYPQNEDGSYNFNEYPTIIPVSWLEWITLPIREYDTVINTCKMKLRVPTVIVAVNFKKIPKKRFRPTRQVLYQLQKGICGYSGKHIPITKGNIEHKKPRSQGGKDTFENLMFVDKTINSFRGDKPLEEVGLKPLFHNKEPQPIPVPYAIKRLEHSDWKLFVDVNEHE